ncbi:HAMP domain-containing sensor histidine kinase [Prochlorococcus sp. MIT 1341]|uniref:sensor histidine kinase n=1 Tax=Prochlorococcus sp. MIT 1341 TaxID=3096221 RepID=UPI002A75FD2A|nr:HAMP domain-containing sensor histidine kinase [Prochlorococcus sp. MIT 1341]
MELSDRFLNLVQKQLSSFQAEEQLSHLVVYVAQATPGHSPSLEAIGEWPLKGNVLSPVGEDPDLREPSPHRRWYPLQEGQILLGVLRAESLHSSPLWPDSLDENLQSTAMVLAHCLSLEVERNKLIQELSQQRQQISLIVHQLRNPLSALRTYAELLLRRLGPENRNLNLVQGLLTEQAQLDQYISGLDLIGFQEAAIAHGDQAHLLLPPILSETVTATFRSLLVPLVDRASATANLQGRRWHGPSDWPRWTERPCPPGNEALAEIIANLLENAFRYSPLGCDLGLMIFDNGLVVWDQGSEIPKEERKKIFEKGFRGKASKKSAGSGLGLSLAREMAQNMEGSLELIIPPQLFHADLPAEGNAFVIKLFLE